MKLKLFLFVFFLSFLLPISVGARPHERPVRKNNNLIVVTPNGSATNTYIANNTKNTLTLGHNLNYDMGTLDFRVTVGNKVFYTYTGMDSYVRSHTLPTIYCKKGTKITVTVKNNNNETDKSVNALANLKSQRGTGTEGMLLEGKNKTLPRRLVGTFTSNTTEFGELMSSTKEFEYKVSKNITDLGIGVSLAYNTRLYPVDGAVFKITLMKGNKVIATQEQVEPSKSIKMLAPLVQAGKYKIKIEGTDIPVDNSFVLSISENSTKAPKMYNKVTGVVTKERSMKYYKHQTKAISYKIDLKVLTQKYSEDTEEPMGYATDGIILKINDTKYKDGSTVTLKKGINIFDFNIAGDYDSITYSLNLKNPKTSKTKEKTYTNDNTIKEEPKKETTSNDFEDIDDDLDDDLDALLKEFE